MTTLLNRYGTRLILLLLSLVFSAPATLAQGIIIGPDFQRHALTIAHHSVDATTEHQIARVHVEQVFYNPGPNVVEGTLIFPLPKNANVSRFTMEIDGREVGGEVLDAEKARSIYESIVRRNIDPALLEWVDGQSFRARVFPIEPRSESKLTLRFEAVLDRVDDTIRFIYPLDGSLTSTPIAPPHPRMAPDRRRRGDGNSGNGDETRNANRTDELRLRIVSDTPIRNIYSPSHDLTIDRTRSGVVVTAGQARDHHARNLVVYYSEQSTAIAATLIGHRPYSDKAGYFMMMIDPPLKLEGSAVLPKDILFVLDTSGSMAGEKIEQARSALKYALQRLGDRDRFGIISFSSDTHLFRKSLASRDAVDDALYFADQLEARGGTNIHQALLEAVDMLSDSRGAIVVFLTDGLPSTGVTDVSTIRDDVRKANKVGYRIFPFGVGFDVNTRLLDGLARESSAFADYVAPDENLEERVSGFYDRVRHPVLTNVGIDVSGIDVFAMAPRGVSDLFIGDPLVIAGRFRKGGNATVTVRGVEGDRSRTFTYKLRFPTRERDNEFVARLWATRRVGQLLEDVQLNGESEELRDEIVALATEFGIVTPYTSYLIQEDDALAGRRDGWFRLLRPRSTEEGVRESADMAASLAPSSGERAVVASKSIAAMQQVSNVARSESASVIAVRGQTLIQNGTGAWATQSQSDQLETVSIQFGSEAYFQLIRKYAEVRPFVQLGSDVTFVFQDRLVQIGDTGIEAITDRELVRLFGT